MFAFFAAGLVGLSIAHILPAVGGPHDRQTWVRTIGMVVGGVMIVGLLLSLLHRGVLTFISTPLKTIPERTCDRGILRLHIARGLCHRVSGLRVLQPVGAVHQ